MNFRDPLALAVEEVEQLCPPDVKVSFTTFEQGLGDQPTEDLCGKVVARARGASNLGSA